MRPAKELIAHQSIVELHQLIEKIFTGRTGYPAAVEQLIDSFSPSFVMVTMQGQVISLPEVEMLFRNNAGTRPKLLIAVDECETLQVSEDSVVCRYRETHHNDSNVHVRWSVVKIDIRHAQPLWCFLQETAINTA